MQYFSRTRYIGSNNHKIAGCLSATTGSNPAMSGLEKGAMMITGNTTFMMADCFGSASAHYPDQLPIFVQRRSESFSAAGEGG